jgi:hypothetical protein
VSLVGWPWASRGFLMGLVPQLISFLQGLTSLVAAIVLVLAAVVKLMSLILKLIKQFKELRQDMKSANDKGGAKSSHRNLVLGVIKSSGLWCALVLGIAGTWILVARAQVADTGRPVQSSINSFTVDSNYTATGKMGDVDDVEISAGDEGGTQFIYTPTGKGQHEWSWKYKDNKLNPDPAKFVGVVYLNPPDDFGMSPTCGWDLRGFHRISWEARSLGGDLKVDFIVGGVNWMWHEEKGTWVKVTPPYPDSMPRVAWMKPVTKDWQHFDVTIEQPTESFKRVVGGFAWTISWGANHVKPGDGRKLTLEIRNVRYEK